MLNLFKWMNLAAQVTSALSLLRSLNKGETHTVNFSHSGATVRYKGDVYEVIAVTVERK